MASKCPNCAGPLRFAPDQGALFCDKCGGIFNPEDIEVEHRDLLEDQEIVSGSEAYGFTDEGEMGDFNVYTCNNCGGEIVINSTEASTFCIYCGSPSIVFSRVSKFRKPKFIMPFKVSKQEAESIIRNRISPNKYIPNEIKNFHVDSIRGIYIPYQVIDVEYRDALFIQTTVGSGKHRRTVYYKRAGKCMFKDLPVESSSKLNDGSSVRLEPYDLRDLVPFDEDYLTGFYSDMCDLSREQLDATIKKRLFRIFLDEVKKTCRGSYRTNHYTRPYIIHQKAPEYAMLPVWFLTFFYENKPHTILVNGQTGKVVCGLPYNEKKVTRDVIIYGLLCSLPLAFICELIGYGAMTSKDSDIGNLIFYAIIFAVCMFVGGAGKFKKLQNSIEKTQSSATFGFVKKRQG
ncbi:MAG: hypothetical protein J5685_05030 [Clostridiales bacterium]|nr:hypothetical protein [Clostridiales bacterium]